LPIDQRADLFSLGCVLYEMCAGRRPFTGPDTMAVLTSLIADRPHEPRVLNPDVPANLSQLVMMLLEKDAARRPASAKDVAEALRQVLAPGSTSTANAPSPLLQSAARSAVMPLPPYPPPKPKGSGEWKALLSALLGLLFLAGIVVGAYYIVQSVPKGGVGTLNLDVDQAAETQYQKYRLIIKSSTGKVNVLLPRERTKPFEPGEYVAELDGPENGVLLQGSERSAKARKMDFKVDPAGKVTLKIVLAHAAEPKSDSKLDEK
jgi:serine/threonine protein kinase